MGGGTTTGTGDDELENGESGQRGGHGRRKVLKVVGLGGASSINPLEPPEANQDEPPDESCFDCTGSTRVECSDVDCVACSDRKVFVDYHGDTDRWRYYEGGPWDDAKYRMYEEVNTGLVYYGTFNNCTGEFVHQFRLVGHGRREVEPRHDEQFHHDPDIRGQGFRVWEDSDRSGLNHSLFVSEDNDEFAACPLPNNETKEQTQSFLNVAFMAGSVAVMKANPTLGTVWTACNLGRALVGIFDAPGGGSGEIQRHLEYSTHERPDEIGHFLDFYVETGRGVDCKINVASEMEGDETTSTHIHTEIETPDEEISGCAGMHIAPPPPPKNATWIDSRDLSRYTIPTPLRGRGRRIAYFELPVTFENKSENETSTGRGAPGSEI